MLVLHDMRFLFGSLVFNYESALESSARQSYENAVVVRNEMVKREGNESISVPFLLYRVFEGMHAALYNGSERGILNHSLFVCVSEYADRYYLICVWCMFHSVMSFLKSFRGLSCMLQPQVKED